MGNLHSQTSQSKSDKQIPYRIRITSRNLLIFSKNIVQRIIDKTPSHRDDRLCAEHVSDHPLRTGSNLRSQITIAGSSHLLRSRSQHLIVSKNNLRRMSLDIDLRAILSHDSTGRCISVHRCGSSHYHIRLLMMESRELTQIIDDT